MRRCRTLLDKNTPQVGRAAARLVVGDHMQHSTQHRVTRHITHPHLSQPEQDRRTAVTHSWPLCAVGSNPPPSIEGHGPISPRRPCSQDRVPLKSEEPLCSPVIRGQVDSEYACTRLLTPAERGTDEG